MNKKTGEHSRVLQRSLHYMEERCVKLPSILFTLGFPPRRFRPAQIVSGTFILNRLIFSQCLLTVQTNSRVSPLVQKLHWNHHFAIFNFFYIFRLVWYSNIKNKILRITKYFRIIYIHAIRHAREHISQEKNFKHWQWSTKITHNPWKAKQHTWDPTTNLQKVNEGRKHSASYRVNCEGWCMQRVALLVITGKYELEEPETIKYFNTITSDSLHYRKLYDRLTN
jgi:hypothetical protein